MSKFSLPIAARLGYLASTLTCATLAILIDKTRSGALDKRAVLLLIAPAVTLFHHLTAFVFIPSLLPFRAASSATLSTLTLTTLIILSLLFFTQGFVGVFFSFFGAKSAYELTQTALALIESAFLMLIALVSFNEARRMTLSQMQKADESLEQGRGEMEDLLSEEERFALDTADQRDAEEIMVIGVPLAGAIRQPPVSWELLGCSPTQELHQSF